MEKNRSGLMNWMLLLTFFLLWATVYMPDSMERYLAYGSILTIGILHGANDLALLKAAPGKMKQPFFRTLGLYLFSVGLAILLFYNFPKIALVLFLLFSGYHFGEQHWKSKLMLRSGPARFFYTAYGLMVLFLLFICQPNEVDRIIYDLSGLTPGLFWYMMLLAISAAIFLLYLAGNYKRLDASLWREGLYILIFFVVFRSTGLMWGFAIYFILWHAIPSLADQVKFLYGTLNRESLMKYIRTALLYWLVSLVGMGLLFLLIRHYSFSFLPVFFSFLAAITFPHVIVIERMNKL